MCFQIAGVVFPVPILLLIPAREYLLPRLFGRKNLAVLDPAPYDSKGQPTSRGSAYDSPQEGRPSIEIVSPSNTAIEKAAEDSSCKTVEAVL